MNERRLLMRVRGRLNDRNVRGKGRDNTPSLVLATAIGPLRTARSQAASPSKTRSYRSGYVPGGSTLMTQTSPSKLKVALVWRGDHEARRDARPESSRFHSIFDALAQRGFLPEPAVYSEEAGEEVRDQLMRMNSVLVWVDPFSNGRRRDALNALLRDVASAGVYVSAHPDVIGKMGAKEVLHRTKALGWGSDTHFYRTYDQLLTEFPGRLVEDGSRVLKQNRSNGGFGVWRITAGPRGTVDVLSARPEVPQQAMPLADFLLERREDFGAVGGLVDQPFQRRHLDGMVRCYMSGAKVAGFGHQLVRALAGREAGPAGPRVYSGPDDDRFQRLRNTMEHDWVLGMARMLGIAIKNLPVIWDADFLLGEANSDGEDTYVLCEINASSVFPLPDEAPDAIAESLQNRLQTNAARTLRKD